MEPLPARASFARDNRAVAAVEFALVSIVLAVATVNVTDIAVFTYQRMEIENAAQMGVHAAFKACDDTHLPAVTKCPGLAAAVTAAIQSTTLGDKVVLAAGYPAEGFYCLNGSNDLQRVSDVDARPADCTAAGNPTLQPG